MISSIKTCRLSIVCFRHGERMITPEEIKRVRLAAGLTQTQAAELVHVTLRSWQRYEAGEKRIHPAMWELFLIKKPPAVNRR